MSLDVYNLSAKELTQLNNSLMKLRENSLLKLHNLQRVNHNLIIENTKLRQTLKYGSKDRERLLMGYRNLKGQSRVKPMDVTVETNDDYTAMVHFKCLLNPSEISDYFSCDFTELQYKVVIVEYSGELVENASTVVTKQNELKLKMLQNNTTYHITVHLYGNNKKLSGETKFMYNRKMVNKKEESSDLKSLESETDKVDETARVTERSQNSAELGKDGDTVMRRMKDMNQTELNTNRTDYTLNLQIDEDYYITCKFTESDPIEKVVDDFMDKNKIKNFLRDSLLKCVDELKSSRYSIKTVDISDLI